MQERPGLIVVRSSQPPKNQSDLFRSPGEIVAPLPPHPRSVCDTRNHTTHARTAGFDVSPSPLYTLQTRGSIETKKVVTHLNRRIHPSVRTRAQQQLSRGIHRLSHADQTRRTQSTRNTTITASIRTDEEVTQTTLLWQRHMTKANSEGFNIRIHHCILP